MAFGSVRPRVGLVGVVAGLTVVALGGPTSAAAALPVVNVSPSTGLADLQRVTVSGRGFSANAQIGTVECRPGALGESDCDLGTLVYGRTDQHGAMTLARYVRRIITVGRTKFDCGAAKGCILGAGNVANLKQANGRTIFFNPKIPPKVATLTVSPNTKLVDHQLVTVSGKNYAPSTSVYIAECVAYPPAGSGQACDYSTQRVAAVDAHGTFTATNVVLERRQVFFTGKGTRTTDCAATATTCNIQATASGIGSTSPATARLAFDPAMPPVTASVQLSPSAALVDLEPVTLTGSGFTPGYGVTVQECAVTSAKTPTCDYTTVRTVTTGFHGQFVLTYFVRRDLAALPTPTGTTGVDCGAGPGTCELTIQGTQAQPTGTVPLTFDPTVPAIAPAISADPSSGLADNQSITVSLSGFTPSQPVLIEECSAEAISENGNFGYCDYTTAQSTGPIGASGAQVSFVVRATLGGQGGLVDCTARSGACVLIAVESGGYYGGGGIVAATLATTGPSLPGFAFTELSFASS